jgi:hypothetical protein
MSIQGTAPTPPPSPRSIAWWSVLGAFIILVLVIIHTVTSVDTSTPSSSQASVPTPADTNPAPVSPGVAAQSSQVSASSPIVTNTSTLDQASVPSTTETKPAEIAVNVSAPQLWSDYQANEVAADDKYKGKVLWVHGTTVKISKTITGSIVIKLATPDEFSVVNAYLQDSEDQKAATLLQGDQIIVLCRGSGMFIGVPVLSDCLIQ